MYPMILRLVLGLCQSLGRPFSPSLLFWAGLPTSALVVNVQANWSSSPTSQAVHRSPILEEEGTLTATKR